MQTENNTSVSASIEERSLDYSALSERLSAQTQAYVEVANALVKIIETTATTRDIVNETHSSFKDDYRVITEKLQELILNLSLLANDDKRQSKYIEQNLENYKSKIDEFERKITILSGDIENDSKNLNKNLDELASYSKKTIDHISIIGDTTSKKIDEVKKQNELNAVDLNSLIKGMQNLDASWTKAKYLFWAINIIIAIIGLLKNFNFIHFEFIPFKK